MIITSTEIYEIFGAIGFLLLISGVTLYSVLQAHERTQRFNARVSHAVQPVARAANPLDEEISLTRVVTRTDALKTQAAEFIGVDLQQAETYPIKWWLVPPLAFLISIVVVELASRPLGHRVLLYIFVLPVAWLVLTKLIFNRFTNRRNAKLLQQFPDALATVVRCVRVGIPMGDALRTVARDALEPTRAEFAILADKVSIGIPLDVALRELSLRIKLTEYQFFATALTLQARSGGGITQTLETLAEVIRKRVGLKARGYALTAEARMSSMILAALPFIAGLAIFFMQRPYILLLFETKSGQSCLVGAVLLMGLGMGTIQFMISNVLK